MAGTISNTTLSAKVYVFTFGQKELRAGTGFQGSRISRIVPKKKATGIFQRGFDYGRRVRQNEKKGENG